MVTITQDIKQRPERTTIEKKTFRPNIPIFPYSMRLIHLAQLLKLKKKLNNRGHVTLALGRRDSGSVRMLREAF